jgi:hypothetical protein
MRMNRTKPVYLSKVGNKNETDQGLLLGFKRTNGLRNCTANENERWTGSVSDGSVLMEFKDGFGRAEDCKLSAAVGTTDRKRSKRSRVFLDDFRLLAQRGLLLSTRQG